MRFDLSQLRSGGRDANVVDGRGHTFFVAQSTKFSSLLHALPMVKGELLPITGGDGELTVQAKRAPTLSGGEAAFYQRGTTLPSVPSPPGSEVPFQLQRIGMQFTALMIDDKTTPPETAHRETYWKTLTAAHSVLREVDLAIAQGEGGESPVPKFKGLAGLGWGAGRYSASSGNIDTDVEVALSMVFASGTGTGEGPHCLIGNRRVLRKLMGTSAGRTGTSGWRHDPRSGQFVYHYRGVPFYETETANTPGSPETSCLYAANLGPTGVNLIYAYGTPSSFGLELEEVSADPSRGVREMVVHGAYALALWEEEALYGVWQIAVDSGP